MEPQEPNSSSLRQVWRRIGATALAIFQNRLDLAALEYREEKVRIFQVLLWGAFFFFLAILAMILVTATIIILFWNQAGLYLLAGFSILYCLLAFWVFRILQQQVKTWPPPFADTISEIKKDCECLRPPK
jgi:uncharacterized membrane protein YqjE